MKKLLLIIALSAGFTSITLGQKGQFRLEDDQAAHRLYVAFGPEVYALSDRSPDQISARFPEIDALESEYQFTMKSGVVISDEKLARLENDARQFRGDATSVTRLKGIYEIEFSDAENTELLALAEKLERLPYVRYCSLVSKRPGVPPADIPPATTDFRPAQAYFNANPGINMNYAHDMGLTGTGIRIRDVEYGMNKQHEEFADNDLIQLGPGTTISTEATPDYVDHGTAVTGIMCADNGSYGISGLSYDAAEFLMFPEWQQTGYNRILAISQSIENSQTGDVILFEMQTGGQTANGYVPQEFNQVSWDLTKAATDAGIVIVAAAGNGNQNLDAAYYSAYMNRGDSGAIIVGGGTANLQHNKIWYSTFGSRVDVQGWAESVHATGYGDFATFGGDYNQEYTVFSGTSSATPLVAGCVVALQQYHFEQTGTFMLPQDIRSLLIETGIPQGTGGHIGPLPNMETAITTLQEMLGVASEQEVVFSVFPNPCRGFVNVHGVFSTDAQAEIFNVSGQKVAQTGLNADKRIGIDGLAAGFYILKITDGKASTSKKILVR